MTSVRVNRWVDFGERVAWTAIQAAGASLIVVLTSDMTWEQGLATVGIATGIAAAKVAAAQRIGRDDLGALPPPGQEVLEPEPTPPTTVMPRRKA